MCAGISKSGSLTAADNSQFLTASFLINHGLGFGLKRLVPHRLFRKRLGGGSGIKKRRLKLRLTQKQLAFFLGVLMDAVYRRERAACYFTRKKKAFEDVEANFNIPRWGKAKIKSATHY